ncbi:MAG TPA: hypothetical protein VIM93_02055 [Kangiella sp.]
MNITNTTSQRFKLGIERLLAGHIIQYRGCIFHIVDKQLKICCFSSFQLSQTPESEAKSKIKNAKVILDDLFSKAPELQIAQTNLLVEYCFCQEYGKGGVLIAKEVNGDFEWYG